MPLADGDEWALLTPRNGLAGWEVKAMLQDVDGVLWLGTDDGVSRIEALDVAAVGVEQPWSPWSWRPRTGSQ